MWVDAQPTICDGCGAPLVFDEMYPVLRQVVDEVMVISEETVKSAIKVLALKNKLIVEGAGALCRGGCAGHARRAAGSDRLCRQRWEH